MLAASSKLGTVVDLAAVERQALAAHAPDGGNNVSIDVYPSAGSLPVAQRDDPLRRRRRRRARAATRSRSASRAARASSSVDVCVVNGENVADGVGITPKLADRLLAAGADAITLGNHAWRREEIGPYLATSDRVIRPANFPAAAPGPRARPSSTARDGTPRRRDQRARLALPRARAQHVRARRRARRGGARARRRSILVDVHAEATSEKVALAHWLDGRVTAVSARTRTSRRPTRASSRGGTAAITDVGMTGPHDSVIGVEAELAIRRMRTGMPVRFETAEGGVRIEGALVDVRPGDGRATAIEPVRVPWPPT